MLQIHNNDQFDYTINRQLPGRKGKEQKKKKVQKQHTVQYTSYLCIYCLIVCNVSFIR